MKILIISLSGMGNTLLFTPSLKALRERFPRARIDALVYKKFFVEGLEKDLIKNTFSLEGNRFKIFRNILELRKNKYDYSITIFPSNKWYFNLIPFLIGANKRVTHSYDVGKIRTLSFLQNIKIKAMENIHDLDQNLNLLRIFGITGVKEKNLIFRTEKNDIIFANEFLKKNDVEQKDFVIGVHPGAGGFYQYAKRCPIKIFAEICNDLIDKYNSTILIFGNKEETDIKNDLKDLVKEDSKVLVVNDVSLSKTAALIKKCKLFVSNDSGLMHLAVAMNVKTIGLFGPTNPSRTAPYGKENLVIRGNETRPHLKYPFHTTNSKIKNNPQLYWKEIDIKRYLE